VAEILCVRHGQASFASDDYDQLSEVGYWQGKLAGQYLLKSGVAFDCIYSGTLKRQIQTAEAVRAVYLEQGLMPPEIQHDARWNELESEEQVNVLAPVVIERQPELAPLLENARTDKKAFQKLVRATFDFWVEHPELAEQGGLETWATAHQRVISVLQEVQHQNGKGCTAGVFTSGGILAIVTAHVLGMPSSSVYPLFEKVINCSITRLIHNRQSIALSSFNEYSYLSAIAPEGDEGKAITYR